MHIRPYVLLGLSSGFAFVGVATIATVSDPRTADPVMKALFGGASFLGVWSFVAMGFSLTRRSLASALSVGFLWATTGTVLAGLAHFHRGSMRLSASIIIATMAVSFFLWWRGLRDRAHE